MKKTALLMPNWLGDFLLALSVAERKSQMSDSAISLIVPTHLIDLCHALSSLETIPFNRSSKQEYAKSITLVKQNNFSEIILVPRSFSSAAFAWRCRIPVRCGIAAEWRSILLTKTIPYNHKNRIEHLTKEYCTICDVPYCPPEQWTPARSIPQNKDGGIVLCPGAIYGPAKKWTGFADIAGQLSPQPVFVLGDKNDRDYGGEIALSGQHVKNLAGKTTLPESVELIKIARVVVSNDSGLMHLAGFLGTPVIGIFGSTSPAWTRPLGNNSHIFHIPYPCSPCFSRTCRFNHYNCLKEIKPEEVLDQINSILTSDKS